MALQCSEESLPPAWRLKTPPKGLELIDGRLSQSRSLRSGFQADVGRYLAIVALLAFAGCSKQSPITGGTELNRREPSATVEMHQAQIAFIGSADAGSGILHYHGRDYPFSVGGLGVGGIGVSTIEAQGAVYSLADISQFGGVYVQGRYGFAVGEASRGDLWLQNNAGIKIHLRAKREGLMLSLGGDGVIISMR